MATNRIGHLSEGLRNVITLMTSTKSNESMLGLPFLVGEFSVGSGEELAVVLLRLFRQMQAIV